MQVALAREFSEGYGNSLTKRLENAPVVNIARFRSATSKKTIATCGFRSSHKSPSPSIYRRACRSCRHSTSPLGHAIHAETCRPQWFSNVSHGSHQSSGMRSMPYETFGCPRQKNSHFPTAFPALSFFAMQ